MTFIPDSISRNQLLSLQVDAEPDFVPAETTDSTEADLDAYIDALLETLHEDHPGPIPAKAVALRILSHLGAWHDMMADKKFSENDNSCLLWAGDEKLIHMAYSCLDRVDLGEDTCEGNVS